jgi:hypothetical protein
MNCTLSTIFSAFLVVSSLLSTFCPAQNSVAGTDAPRPRLITIPPKPAVHPPSQTLPEWNGSFTYNGTLYNYVMVGADPSSGQAALITTWIVPVKIVLSTGQTYDPLAGGTASPLARTILSPLFDSTTTYIQGGVDVGRTQYLDAFQRANFWSIVSNNPDYHLLLGGPQEHISILPELTLNVPSGDGQVGSPFGHEVAEVDLLYFDTEISNYLAQNHVINPSGLPIFETANTYLTENGCCIGGYHSATGAQTYASFGYIGYVGDFAQDVSALSAELGDWADDPLYPALNSTPCGGLAVAGPVNTPNYGTYPYPLHGFTYHLQDMVFLRYFGGPPDVSVNDWWSFQGYPFTQICQNGD